MLPLLALVLAFQQVPDLLSPFDLLDLKRDVVVTPDTAYGLLPPKAVTSAEIVNTGIDPISWSDDGKYLLMKVYLKSASSETFGEALIPYGMALEVYDSSAGTVKEVLRTTGTDNSIGDALWLHGTNLILADVATRYHEQGKPERWDTTILHIRPNGQTTTLATETSPPDDQAFVETCPSTPDGFIVTFGSSDSHKPVFHYWIVRTDGRLIPVKTPEPDQLLVFDVKGAPLLQSRKRRVPGDPAAPFFSVDLNTGETAASTAVPAYSRYFLPKNPKLTTMVTTQTVTELRAKANLKLLWLKSVKSSNQPAAFVGVCDGKYALSPNLQWIAYANDGQIYVRRMAQLSEADYEAALEKWTKRDALSRAGQIAKALQLYATDYDDNLPPGKGNIVDILHPYTLSTDLFEGFSYIFPGGNLTSISDPANTILGVLGTPYGNVNVYADGHAKWAPPK